MLIQHLNQQLREREAQSLRRVRRIVETPCSPHLRVTSEGQGEKAMLAFCSNDYLGFAGDPAIGAALAEGAALWGAGSGASHLISGHSRAHQMLEEELAGFLEPCIPEARTISFCTGYMANVALLTALGRSQAAIFSDQLNHASLIDGASLAKAPVQIYPHGRVDLLADQLGRCAAPIKLIVTDAVFSMDGDLGPMPELLAIAEQFDAWIVVDDAHGFGVLGAHGCGTLSHFGLRSERFIYMGTLGKSAGVAGAFVAAHPTIIEWMIQAARTYIYTTAAPPAIAHTLRTSLRLIRGDEGERRRAKLTALIELFRRSVSKLLAEMPQLGWQLADSSTAIQPLIIGGNDASMALSAVLESRGLWVPAIRPPTVPPDSARLRITLSAAHDPQDVLALVEGLEHAAGRLA
jgi:8-amino-7-oxononanoate synthase